MHDSTAGFIICAIIAAIISVTGGVFSREDHRQGTVNVSGDSGGQNDNGTDPKALRCVANDGKMATSRGCIDCSRDAVHSRPHAEPAKHGKESIAVEKGDDEWREND